MRKWRVGNISMGLLLIGAGILLLVSQIIDINVTRALLIGWPVILIVLGAEMLAYIFLSKGEKVAYDGFSIFFVLIVLVGSLGIYSFTSIITSDWGRTLLSDAYTVRTDVQEIDVANCRALEISEKDAGVTVVKSSEFSVQRIIELHAPQNPDKAIALHRENLSIDRTGGTVTLSGQKPWHQLSPGCFISYHITAPDDVPITITSDGYADIDPNLPLVRVNRSGN